MSKHALDLFICGNDELERFRDHHLTHIISISNPSVSSNKPAWFRGEMLSLQFGDVISEADAKQCRTTAPKSEDIASALTFVRQAVALKPVSLLIYCNYGASRSPALAYVLLADHLGLGKESHALETILKIRPQAVPNKLLVKLGDDALQRKGALLAPLQDLYRKINRELFRPPLDG